MEEGNREEDSGKSPVRTGNDAIGCTFSFHAYYYYHRCSTNSPSMPSLYSHHRFISSAAIQQNHKTLNCLCTETLPLMNNHHSHKITPYPTQPSFLPLPINSHNKHIVFPSRQKWTVFPSHSAISPFYRDASIFA